MKVFNFGSINIDHIYRVNHFAKPGETLASDNYQMMLGGKGANQSIALARAKVLVQHIGRISFHDEWICRKLQKDGVGVYCLQHVDEPTGHAIIQVSDEGENSILLFGGANKGFTESNLAEYLSNSRPGDWLLMQNECTHTADALRLAKQHKMITALNPAPMTDEIKALPLDLVDYLIVNEIEAEQLADTEGLTRDQPEALLKHLHQHYPKMKLVLTLGSRGVMYKDATQMVFVPAQKVEVVDTTAAGDTFIGYFIQQIITGHDVKTALEVATQASAITVQSLGASASIPTLQQLIDLGAIHA
ncbi:ribokinase [Leucothrix mucor]|uniref:ribokinase n=1 Tax=Leucothrix mucor TaxID=45248 RepID=UPI0003B39DA8|nr:ribokinase [Leucothrix mucor]